MKAQCRKTKTVSDIYAIMYEANENSFMLDGSNSLDLDFRQAFRIHRPYQ